MEDPTEVANLFNRVFVDEVNGIARAGGSVEYQAERRGCPVPGGGLVLPVVEEREVLSVMRGVGRKSCAGSRRYLVLF